jgi:hypothetical protein
MVRLFLVGAWTGIMCGFAIAQPYQNYQGANGPIPSVVTLCPPSNGSSAGPPVPCSSSGGGSNSAAVAPGATPSAGSVTAFTNGSGLAALVTPSVGLPVTTAPSTLTYQSTPNASVGTTSAALSINSLAFNSTNFKTMQLCTSLTSTANVYVNPTGGTAVVGQNIYIASAGGCANFGTAALPMPTASATAITDGSSAQTLLASGG